VWSQHHKYHHAHNGDWEKYRGPYATPTIDEYAEMTNWQQRVYRGKCSLTLAPLVGFIYLIFNPRFTWLKGSIELVSHIVRGKLAKPNLPIVTCAASFEPRYWKSTMQYWHMFWNNVVLLNVWLAMCLAIGTVRFFAVYVVSLSVAGGMGFMLFAVQHNFEHSYASDTQHWDYELGVIEGTSFLVLPRWLNWFTANIGYHHIHHLSPKIPNYRLVPCHNQYRHLFTDVTRVKLAEVPRSLKYILWDQRSQRIISISEYQQQMHQLTTAAQQAAALPSIG
jgi:omega-6 fatty acid desaturase (delta-12 desaturase)